MNRNEFRPLPDEFNLGYQPPVREEEEKKKKKRKRLRRITVLAAAVFIVLPLTLHTGLFAYTASGPAPDSGSSQDQSSQHSGYSGDSDQAAHEKKTAFSHMEGTYVSGGNYVHLKNGTGWFFNGRYFIPLTYNPDKLTYRAAGAYPAAEAMDLDSTVYYASAEGKIEITDKNIRMYDPFRQETEIFRPAHAVFDTTYIDSYCSSGFADSLLAGRWTGTMTPSASFPMAYLSSMVLSPDGSLQIRAGDNMTDNTEVFDGTWSLEDCILRTSFALPLKYKIVTDERTISCEFSQQPEGILFITQDGYYLFLNIFSSQLFVH